MIERALHIIPSLCPDAQNNSADKPIHITLYTTSVNGVREGASEVVCPVLLEGKCFASEDLQTRKMYQESIASIGSGTEATAKFVSSFPDCIQKNPQ